MCSAHPTHVPLVPQPSFFLRTFYASKQKDGRRKLNQECKEYEIGAGTIILSNSHSGICENYTTSSCRYLLELEEIAVDDIALGLHFEVKTCDQFRLKTIIRLMNWSQVLPTYTSKFGPSALSSSPRLRYHGDNKKVVSRKLATSTPIVCKVLHQKPVEVLLSQPLGLRHLRQFWSIFFNRSMWG